MNADVPSVARSPPKRSFRTNDSPEFAQRANILGVSSTKEAKRKGMKLFASFVTFVFKSYCSSRDVVLDQVIRLIRSSAKAGLQREAVGNPHNRFKRTGRTGVGGSDPVPR